MVIPKSVYLTFEGWRSCVYGKTSDEYGRCKLGVVYFRDRVLLFLATHVGFGVFWMNWQLASSAWKKQADLWHRSTISQKDLDNEYITRT
jgi:hypothetical protein